jgi:outer membrane protein assembly factor BamA
VNRIRFSDCDVVNQGFGTRIAVANVELRVPLIRPSLGGGGIGIPPVEAIAFADAGTAWNRGQDVVFQRGVRSGAERGILTSAGVGGRVNLFGYFVVEVDYVRAFERERGWHWQFALQPGF